MQYYDLTSVQICVVCVCMVSQKSGSLKHCGKGSKLN